MSSSGRIGRSRIPPSGGVVDGFRDRGRNACRGQLAEAFDAENADLVVGVLFVVIDRQMHCSGDPGELAVGVHALDHRAELDD